MEKKKSANRKIVFGGVAIILLLGAGLKILILKEKFYYAGTIEATRVDVPSRVSSVVATRNVKEGEHVSKGQTLMTFLCEDYRLANQIATRDYERAFKLYKEGSQSQEAYDQLKNRKDDADLKISWCSVQAPLAGVVLNKYHEVGEMVTPGTRLFTLANLKEDIYAYIYVPQPEVAKINLGMKLKGVLPELKDQRFEGTVISIASEAEFTPKNVQTREERTRLVFAVKVSLENANEVLKPGMTIEFGLP